MSAPCPPPTLPSTHNTHAPMCTPSSHPKVSKGVNHLEGISACPAAEANSWVWNAFWLPLPGAHPFLSLPAPENPLPLEGLLKINHTKAISPASPCLNLNLTSYCCFHKLFFLNTIIHSSFFLSSKMHLTFLCSWCLVSTGRLHNFLMPSRGRVSKLISQHCRESTFSAQHLIGIKKEFVAMKTMITFNSYLVSSSYLLIRVLIWLGLGSERANKNYKAES